MTYTLYWFRKISSALVFIGLGYILRQYESVTQDSPRGTDVD